MFKEIFQRRFASDIKVGTEQQTQAGEKSMEYYPLGIPRAVLCAETILPQNPLKLRPLRIFGKKWEFNDEEEKSKSVPEQL